MIEGGAVIGQGQNQGGSLAVDGLKSALLENYGQADNWRVAKDPGNGSTRKLKRESILSFPLWFHEPTETKFDFGAGGNRPDVIVEQDGQTLIVAEIKGRKDLSNTWESWIPQVNAHMESWKHRYPGAKRGVFMTVFTNEMVTGNSQTGKERRRALKMLYDERLLHFAINLTLLKQGNNRR